METKHPFIEFSDNDRETCCCCVLPVLKGSDIAFLHSDLPADFQFRLINIAGKNLTEAVQGNNGRISLSAFDLSGILAPGDCFRIKAVHGNKTEYSTVFVYTGCRAENTALFEFWDKDGDFHGKIRLSCTVEKPNPKTDKQEYVDSNGTVHALSKTRRKEYKVTTDFYPEQIHNAVAEMLMYPNLLADDTAMYESGDFEIQWDEADENGHARATTKLSEQDISRYSICE